MPVSKREFPLLEMLRQSVMGSRHRLPGFALLKILKISVFFKSIFL